MTPPQASEAAVGAQAGAVALLDALIAEIRLEARDGTEAGHDMSVQRDWANRIARARKKIATPPAAVSVEALEGLAAEWEAEAAALLGKSKRAANHVAAASLNTRAAQLRKLIKERSK